MKARVSKLIADEKQAVVDYGKGIKAAHKESDPEASKTFHHIQGEEKEHARELKKLNTRRRQTRGVHI